MSHISEALPLSLYLLIPVKLLGLSLTAAVEVAVVPVCDLAEATTTLGAVDPADDCSLLRAFIGW